MFVVGTLLVLFSIYDMRVKPTDENTLQTGETAVAVRATFTSVALLIAIVGCVFVDPLVSKHVNLHHFPLGATLQLLLGALAYTLTPKAAHAANDFSLEPVKEVALLFAGIFTAMLPALAYLAQHGPSLGINTPTTFYWATGGLSAVLDNAPTYLNFVQVAVAPADVDKASLTALIAHTTGTRTLHAISTAAVFFGAMTYIGNGPNFMVRSIAQRAFVKMPSFFAYVLWACVILLPVLVLHWAIFVR